MGFLAPKYLWALLALLIPLAIHLWSKKEGKTIKVGSIKFFSESDSKKSRSIKLNELLLLFLRTLIALIVVLILSEPYSKSKTKNSQLTYVIEPSLLEDDRIVGILDTLSDDVPVKLLQTGLTDYTGDPDDIESENLTNYWHFVPELEALPTDSIVVFTNGFVKHLRGKRPTLNKASEWIQIDASDTINELISARNIGDDIELLELKSRNDHLAFNKLTLSKNDNQIRLNKDSDSVSVLLENRENSIALNSLDTFKIEIRYSSDNLDQLSYFRATINTLSKYLMREFELIETSDGSSEASEQDLIICLGMDCNSSLETIRLVLTEDPYASQLITPGDSTTEYLLTRKLNSENIVDDFFPSQLLGILDLNSENKKDIYLKDRRSAALEALKPVTGDVKTETVEPNISYLSKWLWMGLFGVMIIERLIAYRRKQ